MERRNLFRTILAAGAGVAVAVRGHKPAQAAAPVATGPGTGTTAGKVRVAYHLSEAERVGFVLGNIQNHVDGTGGPGHVDIFLVVHGPALRAFHTAHTDPRIADMVARLVRQGVGLGACANTLHGLGATLADVLPGFEKIDEGGVVRLAKLQSEGWAYLRP